MKWQEAEVVEVAQAEAGVLVAVVVGVDWRVAREMELGQGQGMALA